MDIPQVAAIQMDPAANPLLIHNPLQSGRTLPSPTVITSAVNSGSQAIQPKAAAAPIPLPSITHLIPTSIPRDIVRPIQQLIQLSTPHIEPLPAPINNIPVIEPERRYNFRENRKAPERYGANYSLPTNIKPYHITYGISNVGIPVATSTSFNHCVNMDKIKARIIACRISMRQALKDPDPQRATAARSALIEELTQLVESGTFDPKLYNSLNQEQRRRVIPSHMFFKDKFFADGRFQKLKARLVAGGNFVDTSLIGDISSWTVNPITVMMMLNMTALAQLKIWTIDVKLKELSSYQSCQIPQAI